MKTELLPCPFCGGQPEEDATACAEYYGHEHQDYMIRCMSCGAEVTIWACEWGDVPCSCCYDTRQLCIDKWNTKNEKEVHCL